MPTAAFPTRFLIVLCVLLGALGCERRADPAKPGAAQRNAAGSKPPVVGFSQIGAESAWRLETAVVVAFVAIGLLGVRLPSFLIVGYSLHGVWDLLHELQAHGAYSAFEPGQLTPIPLAYGVFCAAFDFCIASSFYTRRAEWVAAWKAGRRSR